MQADPQRRKSSGTPRALNSLTVSSKPSMVATPMPTLTPADLICSETALMAAPTCQPGNRRECLWRVQQVLLHGLAVP